MHCTFLIRMTAFDRESSNFSCLKFYLFDSSFSIFVILKIQKVAWNNTANNFPWELEKKDFKVQRN